MKYNKKRKSGPGVDEPGGRRKELEGLIFSLVCLAIRSLGEKPHTALVADKQREDNPCGVLDFVPWLFFFLFVLFNK